MNLFSKKKFYPVIHCVNPYTKGGIGHAFANIRIAIENGADGVFLIGHRLHHADLFYIYEQVRKQFPDTWIGINFLDVPVSNASTLVGYAKEAVSLNALWIDELPEFKLDVPKHVQVFGGVAFKYINPNPNEEELSLICNNALHFVDVATTSGDKTGSPPDVSKLERIKGKLGGKIPLAVASGVDQENVYFLLETVDIFLVASSICQIDGYRGSQEYLVPEKVKLLSKIIHGS